MYELGPLIRRMRKQRNMTQEDLAFQINLDRTTLSKIEQGKSMPNSSTLHLLFQKLGYDPQGFGDYMLSKEEAEWERTKSTIETHVSRAEYKEAEILLDAVANDAIPPNTLKQYVLYYRGHILLHTGKSAEALDIFLQAMKTTLPSFDESHIKDYHLTHVEINTVNMLSSAYAMCGKIEKAIEVITALKENFDHNCQDRNLWGKRYPLIIYHLTRYLCLAKRHSEALELCAEGRKSAVSGYSSYLPFIALNEAYCYAELGNHAQSKKLFQEVYHTFNLFDLPTNAEAVKRDAKKYVDLDL